MKKFITILSILLIVWLSISYIDIITTNTHAGAAHNPYNAFVLLAGMN